MTYAWRAGTSIWEMANRTMRMATAMGRLGARGTAISARLDGRWLKTIVFSTPILAAMGLASIEDPACRSPATAKTPARTPVEAPNALPNQNTRNVWVTKPPPKESRANSTASFRTVARERSSGAGLPGSVAGLGPGSTAADRRGGGRPPGGPAAGEPKHPPPLGGHP